MSKIQKTVFLFAVSLVAIYFAVLRIFMPGFLQEVLPQVETTATAYLNGKLHIENLSVSDSLHVMANGVSVDDANGQQIFASPEITISFDLLRGILHAEPIRAVDLITIKQPLLRLQMNEKEEWNIASLLKSTEEEDSGFVGRIAIKDGQAHVSLPEGEWDFGVSGSVDASPNPNYDVNFKIKHDDDTLNLAGRVNTKMQGRLVVGSKSLTTTPFNALAEKYFAVENLTGHVNNLSMVWSGESDASKLEGVGTLKEIAAIVTVEGRRLPVTANGKIAFSDEQAEAHGVRFTVNGEKGRIDGKINFADEQNPLAKDLFVEFEDFELQKVLQGQPLQGKINGYLSIAGTVADFSLNGLLTSKAFSYENMKFANVKIPLLAEHSVVTLAGAQADFGNGEVFLYGDAKLESGSFSAAAELRNINATTLFPQLGEPTLVNGSLALTGQWQDGLRANLTTGDLVFNYADTEFSDVNLDLEYLDNNVIINNFSAAVNGDGALRAEGSLLDGELKLRGQLAAVPLTPFLHFVQEDGVGDLTGTFLVSGTLEDPVVEANVRLTDANLYQQEIRSAQGVLEWRTHRLIINDLKLAMSAGTHLVNGFVDFSENQPRAELTLLTKGIRVEPLVALVAPELQLTGNLDNEVKFSGSLKNPSVQGTLKLYDGSYNEFLIDDIVGEYTYENNILTLSDFIIHALRAEILFNGTMDSQKNLNFILTANQIDLKKLVNLSSPEITGLANLDGRITGTLDNPLFVGGVQAAEVTINRQPFTNVTGDFNSFGGTFNTLKGKAQQGTGSYDIDLLLDIPRALFQGNIGVSGGEIASLLKIGGLNYDITGQLYGNIDINKAGKGSGIHMTGDIQNCSIRGIKYVSSNFDVTLQKNILMINKLYAQEDTQGFMAARGTIDFNNRNLDLEVFSNEANAALLTAFMQNPIEFGGKMNFAAQITGTIDHPEANASLAISQGTVMETPFDNLYGMVTLRDDIFKIEQLFIQKDIYKASAYGTVPYDLFRPKGSRLAHDAQMNIIVKLDNANLAILPTLNKNIEAGSGDTKGEVFVTGTLEEPTLHGGFDIINGVVKLKQVNTPIENLNVGLVFDGNILRLQNLSAKIGPKGSLTANGNFAFLGTGENYKLDMKAEEIAIDSSIFTGIINGNLSITPQRNRPLVAGELRFDKVLINMPTIPEIAEGDSNIGLDVKIVLGPEVHLYNKYLYDLALAGGLHIQGSTRYTNVDGSITATKGTVTYLRTPFKVRRATAGFPTPGSILPQISLDSVTKFGRYTINMKIDGPLEQMNLTLTSDPPLSQQELFRMLTLKSYSNGGMGSGTNGLEREDLQALLDVGLEMTFLSDVESLFKEELKLDQFRVYSGNTASGIGFDLSSKDVSEFTKDEREQYNVLIGKYISDNVLVGYASSLDGDSHNVFTQYDIDGNVVLNFSLDEKQRKWIGVEYHHSF
ncbi:MAG TPA: translocation/assembly module TamB domain-containing protein [Candidatus Avacidaminococcus intestinavium]|uniref:Translocation/assembly module TamB domain-containing protein n=1 Tax=Candidatus Avacidaminococcus intestinavium TaxID=2840684 RepID=A0A9D1MNW3_9FIRM|nr:translocation/assembly module TamB domain-containing protein [Candidatus Avacidaminococcus intestinavium]